MRQGGGSVKKNLSPCPKNSSSPRSPRNYNFVWFAIVVLAICFCSFRQSEARPDSDIEDFWKNKLKQLGIDEDSHSKHEEDRETMETIVNIIVGIVVFFFVALLAFIACLCCPICLLAKMRGRRRGVVYRSAVTTNNGTTVTTQRGRGGTTITISGPPRQNATPVQTIPVASSTASPQVIAISNNPHQQNKPYPVQESVTVVPLITAQPYQQPMPTNPYPPAGYPQQQVPYSHQQQFDASQQPQHYSGPNNDPPPPYPGLTREIDQANLSYNPYYTEGAHQASAPPAKE